MRFLAIDVETANADRASICALGAVEFIDGQPSREWYSRVNPKDHFDRINSDIHGITEDAVSGAPEFPAALLQVVPLLTSGVTVSHTAFDRVAIERAASKYGVDPWPTSWLDSCRIARRAWPDQFGTSGYGLAAVAKFLGIEFKHHHALEDARAAGMVICRAVEATGISLGDWASRVREPINSEAQAPTRLSGSPDGSFAGETIAFTGSLKVPRREAASMAAGVGFDVVPGVSKKLSVLVVGDQDARQLHGHEASSKHRKAESLIQAGHPVVIVTEADFFRLLSFTG